MSALIMFMTVLYTMMNNLELFLFLPYQTFLVRFFSILSCDYSLSLITFVAPPPAQAGNGACIN